MCRAEDKEQLSVQEGSVAVSSTLGCSLTRYEKTVTICHEHTVEAHCRHAEAIRAHRRSAMPKRLQGRCTLAQGPVQKSH